MSVHLHMSLSLKPYSWHIVHYANLILCLFNHDFQWEKLERRRFRIVKRDRLPRSSEENKPSEVSEENRGGFQAAWAFGALPGLGDASMLSCSSCHCMVRW